MLIFLAFYSNFYILFFNFVLMRSKLFKQRPKTAKTSAERWVRVFPDNGAGYRLFDPDDHWIYDGELLTVDEQEDIAGFIGGNIKEMEELIKTVKDV